MMMLLELGSPDDGGHYDVLMLTVERELNMSANCVIHYVPCLLCLQSVTGLMN
jgi:hypothetical protein